MNVAKSIRITVWLLAAALTSASVTAAQAPAPAAKKDAPAKAAPAADSKAPAKTAPAPVTQAPAKSAAPAPTQTKAPAPAPKPTPKKDEPAKAAPAKKAEAPAKTPAAKPVQKPAPKKTPAKPAPKKAEPKPAAATAAKESTAGGRRDPFTSLVSAKAGGSEIPQILPPGPAGLVIAQLTLNGIVKGPNGMIAVVTNPQKRVYFLREGARLFNGQVEKITMDSVSFREQGKDVFGKQVDHQITRRLYPSAGEQQ
ncbi:MAG: hypothetical protein HY046_07385 [Acidobacteria bacterium]|nr:hypothetical protein [Acidobacteriota bacterium]